jgi:hypothetical protein
MTDNGTSFRSPRYTKALRLLKIKHLRTKPYTPKTNGKAERFAQTSLREWAYARAYSTSDHRAQHLPGWLHQYNWHRPHSSLKSEPPISRLGLTVDNLLRLPTDKSARWLLSSASIASQDWAIAASADSPPESMRRWRSASEVIGVFHGNTGRFLKWGKRA